MTKESLTKSITLALKTNWYH